mmetsp:Transcript_24991/g.65566  ORF Transcript_24991/g.65566 Transcript_24991/m.65566 type:complete len:156 (-) Transcript_24991:258-725(-)
MRTPIQKLELETHSHFSREIAAQKKKKSVRNVWFLEITRQGLSELTKALVKVVLRNSANTSSTQKHPKGHQKSALSRPRKHQHKMRIRLEPFHHARNWAAHLVHLDQCISDTHLPVRIRHVPVVHEAFTHLDYFYRLRSPLYEETKIRTIWTCRN